MEQKTSHIAEPLQQKHHIFSFRYALRAFLLIHFFAVVFPCSFSFHTSLFAETSTSTPERESMERDPFDYLKEEKNDFYGSERDEKIPVRNPLFQIEDWQDHYSLNITALYNYRSYPQYRSYSYIFPPLPLIYVLKGKEVNAGRSYFFPFFYYKWADTPLRQISSTFIPLLLTDLDWDMSSSEQARKNISVHLQSPLFDYYTHDIISSESSYPQKRKLDIPWVPFFLRYRSDTTRSVWNLFLISGVFIERDVPGKWKLWLAPFFFHNNAPDGWSFLLPFYFHSGEDGILVTLLPPLYMQYRSEEDAYLGFFPLFHTFKAPGGAGLLTPLFGHIKNGTHQFYSLLWTLYYNGNEKGMTSLAILPFFLWQRDRRFVFFPLYYRSTPDEDSVVEMAPFPVPLYYRSQNKNGGHLNLLGLFDAGWDAMGLNRIWTIPIFFYKKDSYLHLLPILFSSKSRMNDDSLEEYSFGPLHYMHRSKQESTAWLGYLFYAHENAVEQSKMLHFFPFYFSWKTRYSAGRLILPLSIHYEDAEMDADLYFAFYNSLTTTLRPGIAMNEKGERAYSLKWEASLFYNVFSIETKYTIFKGSEPPEYVLEESNDTDANVTTNNADQEESPSISGRTSFDVDAAENYFRTDLLFGLFSYVRADSNRHLRVLPLAWLTWSDKNEDRLFLLPPILPLFVNYRSGDESYFLLFPFYGSQMKGDSYRRFFMLNLYVTSYDASSDGRYHYLLWPLIAMHYSPDSGGFWILPFLYMDHQSSPDGVRNRWVSPLFYYRSSPEETRFVSILYHSRERDRLEESGLTLFPIIPLYASRYKNQLSSSGGILGGSFSSFAVPIYHYSSSFRMGIEGNEKVSENSTLLTPLFCLQWGSTRHEVTNSADDTSVSATVAMKDTLLTDVDGLAVDDEVKGSSEYRRRSLLWYAPLFNYSSESHFNGEANYHVHFMGIFDYKHYDVSDDYRFYFFPYLSVRSGGSDYHALFPFFYRSTDSDGSALTLLFPFFFRKYYGEEEATTAVFPLFYYYHYKDDYNLLTPLFYLKKDSQYSYQNFALILDHKKFYQKKRESWGAILGFFRYTSADDEKSFSLLYGVLGKVGYYGSSLEEWRAHFLFHSIYLYNSDEQFMLGVFPLFHFRVSDDGSRIMFPSLPFLYYQHTEPSSSFRLALMGLLWYGNREYEESLELGLLGVVYFGLDRKERGYHSVGSLWGVLWQSEREDETGFKKFSILAGVYSKTLRKNGETKSRLLGIPL